MTEIWLHSNRRVLLLSLVPAGLLGAAAVLLLNLELGRLVGVLAWTSLAMSVLLIVGLILQLAKPRVAFRENHVLFYLKSGAPIEVPVKVVEAFFLGQGPSNLPVQIVDEMQTVNLVARLSQRAPEWERQDVKSALGKWCDSYVTIRGTWCEPLTGDVVRRLNRRLKEVSKENDPAIENEKVR